MHQQESHTESAEPGQPPLRGFWSLILTQFEGAFNDNALKMVVTFVGLNMALSHWLHDALVPLTTGLFSLPFKQVSVLTIDTNPPPPSVPLATNKPAASAPPAPSQPRHYTWIATLSDLVNQAYALTPAEIALLWQTAPPWRPLPSVGRPAFVKGCRYFPATAASPAGVWRQS
jgi:hypothetical protein